MAKSATKAKPASEKKPVERIEHEGLLDVRGLTTYFRLGVGDVTAVLVSRGASGVVTRRFLPSRAGVVGRTLPRLASTRIALAAGDVVVLAGRGPETAQVFASGKRPLVDAEVAAEALASRGA